MPSIPKQVGDEVGELFKKVGQEVVKAPGSIVQEALGGTKPKGQTAGKGEGMRQGETHTATPLDTFTEAEEAERREIARRTLKYIAQPPPKEPTVQEWTEREEVVKQEEEKKKAEKAAAMAPIETPKSKRTRGDLFGKQKSAESRPSVRQD